MPGKSLVASNIPHSSTLNHLYNCIKSYFRPAENNEPNISMSADAFRA